MSDYSEHTIALKQLSSRLYDHILHGRMELAKDDCWEIIVHACEVQRWLQNAGTKATKASA
jgi:hypothetical protein